MSKKANIAFILPIFLSSMYKKILASTLASVALLGAGCQSVMTTDVPEKTTTTSTTSAEINTTGKVIFSVTGASLPINNITEVDLLIRKIEMHSTATGWITVTSTPITFHLSELKAKNALALAGSVDVLPGTYNQVRVTVGTVKVLLTNGTTINAKVPSNEIKLIGKIEVTSNTTSTVQLDFLADASLHVTGSGQYIFAPVIKMESRSNTNVTFPSPNRLEVMGGANAHIVTQGMDLRGEMKEDFRIDKSDELKLEDGVLKMKNGDAINIK